MSINGANALQLKFRDNEVLFNVKSIKGGGDKISKSYRSDIDINLYGADTESVIYEDENGMIYEPQCSTISDPNNNDHILWHKPESKGFFDLLEFFLKTYGKEEMENGNKKCIIYYHNLAYDWLQLVKQVGDLLTMAKTGIYKVNSFRQKDFENPNEDKDYFIGEINNYLIFLKDRALFVGSAPHFTFRVMKSAKVFFDITFYDTFSFFKGSLENVAKELKLPVQKMKRQKDIGKIDYRLISDDVEDKKYFVEYAKVDAKTTRLAGEAIREIHKQAGLLKFRVSSPSFAIQFLFKQLKENNTVLNGSLDPEIMQLILDSYRGGRTGGVAHGRIKNISVLDFASSYPCGMLSLPSFSPTMKYIKIPLEMLEDKEAIIKEIKDNPNCFLNLDGNETDNKYPSLIAHNKTTKKLTPIYGEFSNMVTTGYEFICGIQSGTLTVEKFNDVVFLVDTETDVQKPFADFAKLAFEGKQKAEKGTILYTMWKLVLNGAYGKLIESRKKVIVSVEHEEDLIPYLPSKEMEFHTMFYDEYIRAMRDGLDWDEVYTSLYEEVISNFDVTQLKFCAFSDINIGGKDFGTYAVPAAASLITGVARSRLRALMKCTNALYWDTDSVFIEDFSLELVTKQLELGTKWLSWNVTPLAFGEQLGYIDCELLNGTGYLAGTKRYYITKTESKKVLFKIGKKNYFFRRPKTKVKSAIHGLPSLPKEDIERMIKYLATNDGIGEYQSKAKPLKGKEAPNNRLIGAFIAKEKAIRSLYNKDDRLIWELDSTNNRFIGTIIEWKKLVS